MMYPCDSCGKEVDVSELRTICVLIGRDDYDKQSFCPECFERAESLEEAVESNWRAEYEMGRA